MLSHAVLEFTHDLQQDLDGELQGFSLLVPRCPEGAKYIWCVRELCACADSYFKMLEGWFFQPVEVPVEDFIREMWLSTGKPRNLAHCAFYFHHLASWWPHRNDDVLLVFYEDLHELWELCSLYCWVHGHQRRGFHSSSSGEENVWVHETKENVCKVCLCLCSHAWVKLFLLILAVWPCVVALFWHVVVSWLATENSK